MQNDPKFETWAPLRAWIKETFAKADIYFDNGRKAEAHEAIKDVHRVRAAHRHLMPKGDDDAQDTQTPLA